MKKVAVHNRDFHADDVFAVAILRLIYPKIKIIRTRDIEELKKVDIRVDVGRKYDPKTNDFDHHQGVEERENGIPYASAGLIWKHFGKKLVSSDEVFNYIDEKIIQFVDADDAGLDTYSIKKLDPYTIADFIKGLNPQWPNETTKLFNKYFEEAVSVINKLLKREIEAAEELVKSKEIIREKIKESNGKYLLLEEYIPWKNVVVEESDLDYVVYRDPVEGKWVIRAVPISLDGFENRKDLPKEWSTLEGKEFEEISGVKDVIFCHKNLFIAFTKSKESALKLVEIAIQRKK